MLEVLKKSGSFPGLCYFRNNVPSIKKNKIRIEGWIEQSGRRRLHVGLGGWRRTGGGGEEENDKVGPAARVDVESSLSLQADFLMESACYRTSNTALPDGGGANSRRKMWLAMNTSRHAPLFTFRRYGCVRRKSKGERGASCYWR